MDKIEKKWDYFGETNPYFAVSTFDKFKSENLDGVALEDFFESGEKYVERIWNEVESNFQPDFQPRRAIDFGCGVGRISLPMAKRCETVIGIDISEKMLNEARQNSEKFNVNNVKFVKGDNDQSNISGEFDFIHSFIVFQHIKPNLGEVIFRKFIEMLSVGGIGALHFTYFNNQFSLAQKFRFRVYRDYPWIYKVRNFVRKRKEPLIQMHLYDLNRLFIILQENDCHKCHIRFSQHGGEGALLIFQKRKEILY